MGKYGPYERYKDSGVEWLGEIPGHWEVKRLKNIASCNDDSLSDNTDPDYTIEYVDISSVDLVSGITHYENMIFENAPSRARRKVKDGDTIVSTVRTYLKSIAAIKNPPDNLIVSTGFAVIRPKPRLDSNYIGYLLQSEGFIGDVVSNSNGVSYPAINPSVLTRLPVVEPPLHEQQAIAQFLDYKTKQIDELIQKKEALLEKLDEKRTALISHAVTKGLDPDVPMKDSGVEWLGEIPGHWEAVGLTKYLQSLVDYRGKTPGKTKDGIFLVTAKNIKNGIIDYSLSQEFVREDEYDEIMRRGKPEIGDVLLTTEAPLGEVANIDNTNIALAQRVIKMQGRTGVLDNYFLKYWILGASFSQNLQSLGTGSTALGIKASKLCLLKVVLPPLHEQTKIAQFLDQKTEEIDEQKTQIKEGIKLLKEYRTALITNAVTGKIDVRQIPK